MTTAVISVETVLLLVLLVLVAGLLRSHAEILRRLDAVADPARPGAGTDPRIAAAVGRDRPGGTPAPALSGPTPDGDAISLDLAAAGGAPTLLAFLTTGCSTCAGFWSTLAQPRLPAGVRTVIVTHGSERERPATLRELAPDGIPVIMSSQAWRDYAVPGAPYFVLADATIRGEGAATSWTALASLVSDAIADAAEAAHAADAAEAAEAAHPADAAEAAEAAHPADAAEAAEAADAAHPAGPAAPVAARGMADALPGGAATATGGGAGGTARALSVDRTLAAAGIGPGHASLYPGGPPGGPADDPAAGES